ncbi:efflux RND transporter periplasmic adaptor subunit [Thermopolyspora sp. NPDC052614]|uniref:efflux RND transporter periplasmic adaptor subunit n=1 Tax=Thermopolyspora sp. NPDC052614 TaxID=3155682 RepID=UPI003412CF30
MRSPGSSAVVRIGVIVLVGVVIVSAGLLYLSSGGSPPEARIELVSAKRGTVSSVVSAAGTTVDANQRELAFGADGGVEKVYVKVGDKVDAGQLLAKIDDTAAREQYEEAKAKLAAAEENLENVQNGTSGGATVQPAAFVVSEYGGSPNPGPSATPEVTRTVTARSTVTVTATPQNVKTVTARPTATRTVTATPTKSVAAEPRKTVTVTPTVTVTATAPNPKPTATVTVTATPTVTVTATPTVTVTATRTVIVTAAPTAAPTSAPTATSSPPGGSPPVSSPSAGAPGGGGSAAPSATPSARPSTTACPSSGGTGAGATLRGGSGATAASAAPAASTACPSARPSNNGQGQGKGQGQGAKGSPGAGGAFGGGAGGASGGGRTGGGQATSEAQAEAAVTQAKNDLEDAREALAGVVIKAPVAGTILSIAGTVGTDVTAGATFIQLGNLDELQIKAMVTQSDVEKLKVGQRATVTLATRAGERYAGRVTHIDPVATTSGDLVQYGVLIAFSRRPPDLLLGQNATITVTVEESDDAVLIPAQAVRSQSDGTAVVTVETGGGTAQRTVKVGVRGDQYVEVLDGLREGDRVVLPGSASSGGFPDGTFPGLGASPSPTSS